MWFMILKLHIAKVILLIKLRYELCHGIYFFDVQKWRNHIKDICESHKQILWKHVQRKFRQTKTFVLLIWSMSKNIFTRARLTFNGI
jgi:hypothetical protein